MLSIISFKARDQLCHIFEIDGYFFKDLFERERAHARRGRGKERVSLKQTPH